jgi:transposase
MHLDGGGEASWNVSEAKDETLERAAALYEDGASIRGVAGELGIPKTNAERLKRKAQKTGLLTIHSSRRPRV